MKISTVENWPSGYIDGEPNKEVKLGYIQEGKSISVFLLRDKNVRSAFDNSTTLNHSLVHVLTEFMAEEFPGQSIFEYDWTLISAAAVAKVNFIYHRGSIVGLSLSNGFIASHSFSSTVESYQEALDGREEFVDIMSDGYPERYESDPISFCIVPLPYHKRGHILLPVPSWMNDGDKNEVVLVDLKGLKSYDWTVKKTIWV